MSTTTTRHTAAATPPTGFQLAGNAAQRYEQVISRFMLDWSEQLVAGAGVGTGERVLDLACGTGFVARVAAARVGRAGVVTGLDINPAMVEEARRVTGLETVQAPADATGLPDAAYDVVLCQQGLQYVPDPAAALREARRVLRPGGRLAASVWSDFDRNPFRVGQLAAMAPHLPASAAEAYRATGVSALGGVAGLARLLRAAGLTDVGVVEHERVVRLPPMRRYFPALVAATPWGEAFAGLGAAAREAVLDVLEGYVEPDPASGGCSVRMTVAVASGTAAVGAAGIEPATTGL